MTKQALTLISIFAMTAPFVNAESVRAQRGRKLSATCAACHGPNGVSVNPVWPNLAGQKREYILKQLHAFKAGDRKDPLMSPMAAGLSEGDMEDLAAYFSQLK